MYVTRELLVCALLMCSVMWCMSTSPTDRDGGVLMNSLYGPNCPFSGAWLGSSHLLRRTKYVLKDTVIEKALFRIFRVADERYHTTQGDNFFVNHMSQYEHCFRSSGASNETVEENCAIHAESAMLGECKDLSVSEAHRDSNTVLAVMPFFGGKWLHHSVVSERVKEHRAMATLCSVLRHFPRVLVGAIEGEGLVKLIEQRYPALLRLVEFIHFGEEVGKPTQLPFHLLVIARTFFTQPATPATSNSRALRATPTGERIIFGNHTAASHQEMIQRYGHYSAVYFTESDLILRIASEHLREAMVATLMHRERPEVLAARSGARSKSTPSLAETLEGPGIGLGLGAGRAARRWAARWAAPEESSLVLYIPHRWVKDHNTSLAMCSEAAVAAHDYMGRISGILGRETCGNTTSTLEWWAPQTDPKALGGLRDAGARMRELTP